jgi:hypothetical protein
VPDCGLLSGGTRVAVLLDDGAVADPAHTYWVRVAARARPKHKAPIGGGNIFLQARVVALPSLLPVPTQQHLAPGENGSAATSDTEYGGATAALSFMMPAFGTVTGTPLGEDNSDSDFDSDSPAAAATIVDISIAKHWSSDLFAHTQFSAPLAFTFTSLPVIISISPNEGPSFGGTALAIRGHGFEEASHPNAILVKFLPARLRLNGAKLTADQNSAQAISVRGRLSTDKQTIHAIAPSYDSRLNGFFQVRVSINGGLQFSMTSQFSTFFAYSSWHNRQHRSPHSAAAAYHRSLPVDAGEGAHEPGARALLLKAVSTQMSQARRQLVRGQSISPIKTRVKTRPKTASMMEEIAEKGLKDGRKRDEDNDSEEDDDEDEDLLTLRAPSPFQKSIRRNNQDRTKKETKTFMPPSQVAHEEHPHNLLDKHIEEALHHHKSTPLSVWTWGSFCPMADAKLDFNKEMQLFSHTDPDAVRVLPPCSFKQEHWVSVPNCSVVIVQRDEDDSNDDYDEREEEDDNEPDEKKGKTRCASALAPMLVVQRKCKTTEASHEYYGAHESHCIQDDDGNNTNESNDNDNWLLTEIQEWQTTSIFNACAQDEKHVQPQLDAAWEELRNSPKMQAAKIVPNKMRLKLNKLRWIFMGALVECYTVNVLHIEFETDSDGDSDSDSGSGSGSDSDSGSGSSSESVQDDGLTEMSTDSALLDDSDLVESTWQYWSVSGGEQKSVAYVVALVREVLRRNIRHDKLSIGNLTDLVRQCYEEALVSNSMELPMNIHGSALDHLIDLITAHKTGIVGKLGAAPVTAREAANAKMLSMSSNISGPRQKRTRATLIDRVVDDFWSDTTSKPRASRKAVHLLREFRYVESDAPTYEDRGKGTVDKKGFAAVMDEVYPAGDLVDAHERENQVESLWRYAVDRTRVKNNIQRPASPRDHHSPDTSRLDYAQFIALFENSDKLEARHGKIRMQTTDMSQTSKGMENIGPGHYYTSDARGLDKTVPRSALSLPAAVTFSPQGAPKPFILPLGKNRAPKMLAYGIRSSAETFTYAAFQPSTIHKASTHIAQQQPSRPSSAKSLSLRPQPLRSGRSVRVSKMQKLPQWNVSTRVKQEGHVKSVHGGQMLVNNIRDGVVVRCDYARDTKPPGTPQRRRGVSASAVNDADVHVDAAAGRGSLEDNLLDSDFSSDGSMSDVSGSDADSDSDVEDFRPGPEDPTEEEMFLIGHREAIEGSKHQNQIRGMYELFHPRNQIGRHARWKAPRTIQNSPNGCAELAIIVVDVGAAKLTSTQVLKAVLLRCGVTVQIVEGESAHDLARAFSSAHDLATRMANCGGGAGNKEKKKRTSLLVMHCCGRRDSMAGMLHSWEQAWMVAAKRSEEASAVFARIDNGGMSRQRHLDCVVISHCAYHESFPRSTKDELTTAFHTGIGLTLILFSECLPKTVLERRMKGDDWHNRTPACLVGTVNGRCGDADGFTTLGSIVKHGSDLMPLSRKSEVIYSPCLAKETRLVCQAGSVHPRVRSEKQVRFESVIERAARKAKERLYAIC